MSKDGKKMLLEHNTQHQKYMPPGSHVHIEKGQLPHDVVLESVKRETGYDGKLDPLFHSGAKTYTALGGARVDIITAPIYVLSEQQSADIHCRCKWHYDLYYFVKVDEDKKSPRPKFESNWCTLAEIEAFESQANVYSDTLKLAREVFSTYQTKIGLKSNGKNKIR